MSAQKKSARSSMRAPKKPTVADRLRARMDRERQLSAKTPPRPLNEKLFPLTAAPEQGAPYAVWTLRHMAASGRLNYRRIGRRLFITESEIARLRCGAEVRAVNAA